MRRRLNVKLLVWLLAGLTAVGVGVHWLHAFQVRRNARALRQQAERYLAEGQLSEAISYLGQYLTYEPGDTETLAKYALALDQAANSPTARFQAWDLLEQALRREPKRSDWRHQAVRLTAELGQYADAARHLEFLLQEAPNDAHLADLLGRCRENTGEYVKAAAAYRQAVKDNPKLLEAYERLAHVLYFRLERPGQAIEVLANMVAANPRSAAALLVRARFLREIGILNKAWDDLGRARQLASDQLNVLLVGAELAQVQGNLAAARSWLEDGLKAHPEEVRLYQMWAGLEQRAGRTAEVVAVLRRGLKKVPRSPDLLLGLADVLADREPKAAADVLNHARRVGADRTLINCIQARLLAQQEQWDKVGPLLEAAHPHLPFPSVWQAQIALDSRLRLLDLVVSAGRDREAKRLVDDLRQIEGDEGVWWRLGETARLIALARQGRLEVLPQARQLLVEVARRRQGEERLALLKAAIAELAGNRQEALTHYLQALAHGAGHLDVVRRAAHLLYEAGRYEEADEVIRTVEPTNTDRLTPSCSPDPDLIRLAAEVALKRHQWRRARELARAAVPLETRDYREHLWLAGILEAAGQSNQAEEALWRAVHVAATLPEPWIALVRYLARHGRPQEADDVLQQARCKLSPPRAKFVFAQGQEALGRLDLAETYYQKQMQAHPGDSAALRKAADFYLRIGRHDQAGPLLRRLLELALGTSPAQAALVRRQLAVCLTKSGKPADFAEALALLDQNAKAAGTLPEDEEARAAVLASRPECRRQALRLLERLRSRQYLSAKGQYLLVQLCEAAGQPARARDLMLDLLTRAGDQPEYLAHHVRTLLAGGELIEARTYLGRLERLEPHSPRTRQLAQALAEAEKR
jgi:predicted Zn-dependent protease